MPRRATHMVAYSSVSSYFMQTRFLSLCALFGSLVGPSCNRVLLFAELGGKFLGKLDVPQTLVASNMYGVLKDLQLQAFKLMKHTTRPPRDVLLKVGDKPLLPFGFGYKKELDVDQQHVVLAMLQDGPTKLPKSAQSDNMSCSKLLNVSFGFCKTYFDAIHTSSHHVRLV